MSSFIAPPSPPPEAVPIPNRRTDAQPDFDVKTDAYLNWLETFRGWMGAARDWLACFPAWADGVMASANQAATDAQAAAIAAGQAALVAQSALGAQTWSAGASYAAGAIVFGPLNPGIAYRCFADVSGSAIEPENDPAHWAAVGGTSVSLPANPPHEYVHTDFLAEKFKAYEVNTGPAGLTITLPPAKPGDWVYIWDEFWTFGRNPVLLKASPGDTLEGETNNEPFEPYEGLFLDRPYRGFVIYRPGSRGWTIT